MAKTGGTSLTSWVGWMIGALGLAGVAVVGVNMLKVAREVDERAMTRQAAAIDHGMRLLGEFAAGDLLATTQWDEALDRIVWEESLPWMRRHLGREVYSDANERRLLIVDEAGRAVFASDSDGEPGPDAGARAVEAAADAIARAAAIYLKALAEDLYLDDRYGDGLYYGIYAHDIVLLDGVPSLVVASPLVGETEDVEVPDRPVMLLDIRPLTPDVLKQLDALAHLEGTALLPEDAEAAGPVHTILDAGGREVARLTWSHSPAGASVLRSAAPALALSVLVFIVLSWLVSRVLRRGTQALAASEQAALHASRHDPATGLANRGWFMAEFERIAAGRDEGRGVSDVVLIDCDYFKQINDTLGHAAGDAVLMAVSGRLRDLGAKLETVARLGGDEFAAITAPLPSRDEREWLLNAVCDALTRPVTFQGRTIPVSVSIGAAELARGETMQALLAHADMALYRAKHDGRGCFRVYDPAPDAASGATVPQAA